MSSQYGTPGGGSFDYNAFINDTDYMPNFADADSPATTAMFIDPSSTLINPADSAQSPAGENAYGSYRSPPNFASPPGANSKLQVGQSPLQPRKVESSASPESSSQDSSSDSSGRRKRKSPESSSPATTLEMTQSQGARSRPVISKRKEPRIDSSDSLSGMVMRHESFGQDTQMQRLATDMSQGFLLESARNSPKGSSSMTPTLAQGSRYMATPRSVADTNQPSQYAPTSMFDFGNPSRDNSPSAGDFNAAMNSLSPPMMVPDYNIFPDASWQTAPGDMMNTQVMLTPPTTSQNPMLTVNPNEVVPAPYTYSPNQVTRSAPQSNIRPELHVNKIPTKSRVETQIAIKLTLDPLPFGVTKMHLPTSCIAKAKLLAKEAVKSADTLELSAMVFCTSALQKPENRDRAMRLARGEIKATPIQLPRRSSGDGSKKDDSSIDPNDPNLPQNGGEVKICDNCIHREHKRANRKKLRKEEDEAVWDSYEKDRTVFFNTSEYQNFHTPTPLKEGHESPAPAFSPKAMQIDAPMRIGCYCRHMNEKIGFQVIFTVKDWQGRFLAQTITQSILITDDHKTHGPSLSSGQDFGFHEQQFPVGGYVGGDPSGMLQGGLPHRQFRSFTDLPSLHRQQASWGGNVAMSQGGTLSRPASPTSQSGPKKKRKGSGNGPKLPAGLMMTRADQPQGLAMDMTGVTSSAFGPESASFSSGAENAYATSQSSMPGAYITNPPTPNGNLHNFQTTPGASGSNDNTHFYSVPNSAYGSRAASPVSFHRNPMGAYLAQQSMPPGMSAGFSATAAAAASLGSDTPSAAQHPTLWEVNPNKGPITGGVKVTCLGYHFHDGLVVYFDDVKATGIKLWGENTLTCFLPARASTGTVQVTLRDDRNAYQLAQSPRSTPKGAIPFEYIDDSKRQLFESFVRIMSFQQGGTGADPVEYAQAMIDQAVRNSAAFGGAQSSSLAGAAGGNKAAMLSHEDVLLRLLEKTQSRGRLRPADLDSQSLNGRTVLSLACMLGYERLTAALLACGATADIPDLGGITPLMAAAMHDRPAIIRRLVLNGADTTRRNLSGLTALELAASSDVEIEIQHVRRHVRHRSADTQSRSRHNSEGSTRSLWGLPSSNASSSMFTTDDSAIDSDEEDEIRRLSNKTRSLMSSRHSRRASNLSSISETDSACNLDEVSRKLMQIQPPSQLQIQSGHDGLRNTVASLTAWRDHLTAQIQHFQQTAARTLPNLQLTLPPILQDQQVNPWRRLSALVPHRSSESSSPPERQPSASDAGSDTPDSISTAVPPPPAYNEIFPENANMPLDSKPPELTTSAIIAPANPTATSGSSSTILTAPAANKRSLQHLKSRRTSFKATKKPLLRIGHHTSEAQVAELRQLRKESLTSAMDDRKLWYLWLPVLIGLFVVWYFGPPQVPPILGWAGRKIVNVLGYAGAQHRREVVEL